MPYKQISTRVTGQVIDATSGHPLSFISVSFSGSKYGTNTDDHGNFTLNAPLPFYRISFSSMGYQPVVKVITPGQPNDLKIRLEKSQTQLKEVKIVSGKSKRYRNKDNPAVELIQQVIEHKAQNRMESTDYLQYDQYERLGLSMFDMPKAFINSAFFRKYQFMMDTTQIINGQKKTSVPVYFNEKLSKYYYRKSPSKSIQILNAEKGVNIIKFIDTTGLGIYLNRMYGNNIDIYTNNIFIISNQFLSPIADHAPDFYKFFITDTIQVGNQKLVELSFTPRTKGDLLFEGKITVTLDGHYAVAACELNVNKQININFMRSLKINLNFEPYAGGRYYLKKSIARADFGLLKNKGTSILGERTVFYSNYKFNTPQPAAFYQGKSLQTDINPNQADTTYWKNNRTDTLTGQQNEVYAKVQKLENMPSYKRTTWIAKTLVGGYADLGAVQAGPVGALYSFNSQEGSRFQVGGRTTPQFNNTVYLQGYTAFGTRDTKFKYDFATYFSLNKTPFYRFPNDYFKVSYLYDVATPGQDFTINNSQAALSSFHSGTTDYWIYSKFFRVDYVKDFENHFSYNVSVKNWDQQAAGTLVFQNNDAANTLVNHLVTTEISVGLRFAPHEKILQGTESRHTIHSKYPIFNLQINQGIKGPFNGSYNYTNVTANIYKRFYMSQLGYADITFVGSYLAGKVPFPLLNISPANQSIAYNDDAYNQMNYLEFVSDHYAGINFTQSFNGFFLNKIPLISHLKWREYLSFKILYGGLRTENDPLYAKNLYQFPAAAGGANGTYALGKTPYIEAGAGIGNIFKFIRVDMIRRFNYLDHPGISTYGVKFSFSPDF
ncbi:DUF5686 and carboxypeptidase-like regulatory domain-containing protein [Mucilaginibacter polytrichastri]|uniref:DUF5686 and carboxypeptidase-like regulatory domain-containing protein n=1 Tax=Mucilaginibacter polytrichastri TaxID=1302689 RepID=UPI0009444B83|nr:DUF5686 and carboxypeptidase-like regulatory domain-containing protein [Mucilaginibacter polytrichastri]